MIRAEIEKLGIADNTIIIFTSDNGYQNGNHSFSRKVLPYEESVKTPLIIIDPRPGKTQAGKQSDSLTANIDMAATMLDMAGVEILNSQLAN